MTLPKANKTRLAMRQSIGRNLGGIIVSTMSSTSGDSTSLIDTYGLAKGGTNEYNGAQVVISAPVGSIVAGEKSFVASFDATNKDATLSPAFTAAITKLDGYEMWLATPGYTYEEVNEQINQAIIAATDDCITDQVDTSLLKLENIYEYTIPSGFVALHSIEYEANIGIEHLLEDCEDAWTAGTSVTATADTSFKKVGTSSAKFVVADAAAASATLCYEDISEVDISDCDKIEFWMYSSITTTAIQLQFMLGATAAIASPLETIFIPAMTAGTWYRHSISLANNYLDTAIISIGVRQASGVDVGAFTFYLDDVVAIKNNSRVYRLLSPDLWEITQGSTNTLKLSEGGYSTIPNNALLRLSGYAIPAELSTDSATATVDPEFIVDRATGQLLAAHARGSQTDMDDQFRRSQFWLGLAETRLRQARTSLEMNTRFITQQ